MRDVTLADSRLKWIEELRRERDEARAEAARYREALERIERSASEGAAGFDGFALKIAREALGGGDDA